MGLLKSVNQINAGVNFMFAQITQIFPCRAVPLLTFVTIDDNQTCI